MKVLKKEVIMTKDGVPMVGIAIDGDNYEEAYKMAENIAMKEFELLEKTHRLLEGKRLRLVQPQHLRKENILPFTMGAVSHNDKDESPQEYIKTDTFIDIVSDIIDVPINEVKECITDYVGDVDYVKNTEVVDILLKTFNPNEIVKIIIALRPYMEGGK